MMCYSEEYHPDAVVVCPYNKSHKVARSRLQRHLIKCEKNFPDGYMQICPFNATHRFFEADMKQHILTCPTRRFMDPKVYQYSSRSVQYVASRSVSETTSTIDFVEDWSDGESEAQSRSLNSEGIYNKNEQKSADDDECLESLRRPYGYSELMMIETSDFIEDDQASVISCMGMGRGLVREKNKHLYAKIGLGRGKSTICDS